MRPEKNCDGCGSGIRAEAKFCPYCGTKATPPAAEASPPEAQAPAQPPAEPAVTTPAADPTVTVPAVDGHASETVGILPASAESATTQSFPRPPGAAPPPPPPRNDGHRSAHWQAPPAGQAPAGWQPPPGPPPARSHAAPPAAAREDAIPGLLWPVIAMFGLAGLLTAVLFIFSLIGAGAFFSFGAALFGVLFLLAALVFGFFAFAYGSLARLLYTGSRVGPGLTYTFTGATLLSLIFAEHHGAGVEVGMVLVTLGMVAAACVVAFAPSVRPHFAGPRQNPEQPDSIVVVQVLLIAWGSLAAYDALLYFVAAGAYEPVHSVVAGLLSLGAAALAFTAIPGMLHGTGQGRVLASVGAGVALLAAIVGFNNTAAIVLMLGLAVGAVCFAWLPNETRAYFGEAPLQIGTSAGAPAAEAGPVSLTKPSAPSASAPGAGPTWQTYQPQQAPYPYALPPSNSDERNMSMLAHLLGILIGWIGPLIIMLTKGKESPTVRANSVEALNFQLTAIIGYVAAWIVVFIATAVLPPGGLLVVLFLLVVLLGGIWVVAMVFMIVGCVRANRGEQYRYPVNIRMVR